MDECLIIESGGAINDEDVAPIRFPPRHLCGKVFIGKCEAPVMFFLECVVSIAGIQIASLPERDNEPVALFIGCEFQQFFSLLRSDDPPDIFVNPLVVFGRQSDAQRLLRCAVWRCQERHQAQGRESKSFRNHHLRLSSENSIRRLKPF
jgi:hypothetical protein